MVLGGAAQWHTASYVMNPITEKSKGVQKLAEGGFTVQLSLKNKHRERQKELNSDEISVMASNFNKMKLSGTFKGIVFGYF